MEDILNDIIEKNREFYKWGRVADYIPALKEANISDSGLTVIDEGRNIYSAGEYNKKFTIQSISKVISLALAISDMGMEKVSEKLMFEGSERSFDDIEYISRNRISKAINPMMNSGAIITTSMVTGGKDRFKRVLNLTRDLSGNRSIKLNKEVYKSEKATGDRNRAIAYLMKSKGVIHGDVSNILDDYFRQCSIEIDTVDLANIGFNIANRFRGIEFPSNIDKEKLSKTLIAVMAHSGMYNFSGQWSVDIGIPSKSGVAGGILSVVPGKYGIGYFGPSLDKNGNPLVGYKVLKDLSSRLELNIY